MAEITPDSAETQRLLEQIRSGDTRAFDRLFKRHRRYLCQVIGLRRGLDDVLAKKPKSVWLQLGIQDDAFASALERAGIEVVQNRCIMVEHRACQSKR